MNGKAWSHLFNAAAAIFGGDTGDGDSSAEHAIRRAPRRTNKDCCVAKRPAPKPKAPDVPGVRKPGEDG